MTKRAVFLDRDGVINESLIENGRPFAPTSACDFRLIPGVPGALQTLRNAGFLNIVITNQPDLATGRQSWAEVNRIHRGLMGMLAIDLIKVCPHLGTDRCKCRKPAIGMILEAASELNIDVTESYMIGDRWSDIVAGQAAGCVTSFYVDKGYEERKPSGLFVTVACLEEAVGIVLRSFELRDHLRSP